MGRSTRIAYFSMEVALESGLPTYAGGLGVLAGDTLRSCADLGLPVAGVTLCHRRGYFRQKFGPGGEQRELPDAWDPERRLEEMAPRVEVEVGGETALVRAWRYPIVGSRQHEVPVYLLDTDLPENPASVRGLTDHLYGGDERYRLAQEVVLGVGGVRLLRALGGGEIQRFHLNEGHAALAIPELVTEALRGEWVDPARAVEEVRDRCVFTTHTPVPAGHDRFTAGLAGEVLGEALWARVVALGATRGLNMTALALEHARFVNGVAMRHGEVSRGMFPGYPIRSITNGVHAGTWASAPFVSLFDRYLGSWREDPFALRCANAIPRQEIAAAHREAKADLLEAVREGAGARFDPDVLTIGFARRATAYKRPLLLLRDPERLARIAAEVGPIQIVFGGKAHPRDTEGRGILRQIAGLSSRLPAGVSLALLPGYDMDLCRRIVAGCDVWLNTPVPPLEASGTSGMKAALNGVPSLSILDGWWVEGCIEGVTGWAIGEDGEPPADAEARDALHAASLYQKLGDVVAPLFYGNAPAFHGVMQGALSLNASYFHSHRMALQYLFEAYGGTDGELPLSSLAVAGR